MTKIGQLRLSKLIRKPVPKPSLAFKRKNRESRQRVKSELRSERGSHENS